MQRGALLALPLLLTASGLTGCGLFDGSSSLVDALEVMPGSMDRVVFFDRAAAVERLDLDDINAESSEEEVDAYLEEARHLPWRTELDLYLPQMLEDAPFSALDVEWEIVGYAGNTGAFGRVWKMSEDVDLEKVDTELTPYLPASLTLTVVPDEQLIVSGPLSDDVLDTIADDSDSLVDIGSFEELLESTDDVEVADLAGGDQVCIRGSRPVDEELGVAADLGAPESRAFLVHGDDGETRSVLQFGTGGEAAADADARETFLAESTSPISGVPYSEFGDWDIETDHSQVRIDIDYDDPMSVSAAISRGDYLSFCPPS